MTGCRSCLFVLLLVFFSGNSFAQHNELLPTSVSDNSGSSTVYLDKESLGQYGQMVPDFLRDQINTGRLPLYARPHSVSLNDVDAESNKLLEAIGGDREFSAQKVPTPADFREMMGSAGAPFELAGIMGADGAPFLWNYTSIFWTYKRLELRFSIEDGDLPSSKTNAASNAIFRTNGTMERVNPMLGENPKLAAQLFRERVTFKAKKDEPYNFLTIRFVTDFPDGIWVRSPVAPATRRLYGANRDDSILGSGFTLNDLLGYSGHFARGVSFVGPRQEFLTPYIEGTTIETSVDDDCGRFKSKYRNASRSLPHLKGAAATLFGDVLFVPKILQRVDVLYREPTSMVEREELWFDLERGVPVYRISYDHQGVRKHWAINVFETGMVGSEELVIPRLSFIGDERNDRLTLLRYTGGAFCKTLPTDPEILKGFDPSGI
jgi:hypothetical protein